MWPFKKPENTKELQEAVAQLQASQVAVRTAVAHRDFLDDFLRATVQQKENNNAG